MNRSVLHLRASNFFGGPERQILRYAAGSGPRQLLATFVAPDQEEGKALLAAARAAGIEAYALPAGPLHVPAAVRELEAIVRRENVGLICAHGYSADLVGWWAARRARLPVAWFLRGWTGEDIRVRLYEALDRALLGCPDRLVCLSQTQAGQLPARIARDRIRLVVNAVAPRPREHAAARLRLCQSFGFPPDAALIGAAGRLSPEKGAPVLLDAAARLHLASPGARWLIAGDGPLRAALERQAAALGLADVVRFAGHRTDWPGLLPGLDVFVNPSWREQAPNVVLEAMAAGVAVVATRVGAVEEIAGQPACLSLVAAGDAAALASSTLALLEAPDQRTALAAAAAERVAAAYSPARQQEQLQALYQEWLPAAPPQPADACPMVSLVMPVRREAGHLGALLDQLLGQEYPAARMEILVADGGAGEPDDGATALAQSYARRFPDRVRWLANPGRRSSAGRNVGLAAARGEWVVFVDGHCRLPGPHWLRDSMAAAARTGARCLSRPQPLEASGGGWQPVIANVRASRIGHGADSTIFDPAACGWVHPGSSGAAYHRSLLQQIGAYDESFDACEDVEFNQRVAAAGVRAWLAPEAIVYYAARASLGALWRQLFRYGRGRLRLARKHPESASWAQRLPMLWLAWLPVAVAAAVGAAGAWRIAAAATLAVYALVVAGASVGLARRHGWRYLWAAPAAFVTIHAALGAGGWRELFSRRAASGVANPVCVPESQVRSSL